MTTTTVCNYIVSMNVSLLSMGPRTASVAVPPAPVGFQVNGHLSRMSFKSHLSVNDNVDDEIIPGAVHRYSGI
jgi:hypothetical protein